MHTKHDTKTQSIGLILRNARLQKKWTQEQLSERSNVGTRHIMAIENGKRNPGVETLKKLILALDVSAEYVLFPKTVKSSSYDKDAIINLLNKCSKLKLLIIYSLVKILLNFDDDEINLNVLEIFKHA